MMHDALSISSLSREYVYAWVGGALGIETVEVAFVRADEPGSGDWKTAEWANLTPAGADARILVGPGGTVTLTDGLWQMWVRVTAVTETPVLYSGPVNIF
ncbi:hypothetical protein C1I98_06135 [Spongiactinospora gelatinilytica]|uniref:Uncharacterized protein n=1 Tax=Spongiactinospora gelatinilytica TaxID=2666298 RepID=A0A2W2GZL6_9ACTN|nr:hypothetical protein [Spongiactinospora gelatinilytica]PZG53133.1 hypothetical protein C1I98_06135 [Spongiactinospora gelatinilytica]